MPTKTQLRHTATVSADKFFEDYQSGLDQRQIARKYHVSQGLVSSLLKTHPLWIQRRRTVKSRTGIGEDTFILRMNRLADAMVMFEAYQHGHTQLEVSRLFNTTASRVGSILRIHPEWSQKRPYTKGFPPKHKIVDGKKMCLGCATVKPLEDFTRHAKGYGGISSKCRICTRASGKKWRLENPDQTTYKYSWGYKYPEKRRAKLSAKYAELRRKVFAFYGEKCARCGFSDGRALHIDHVNEDGASERRKYTPLQVVRRIVKLGFPDTYQILCANCNTIKGVERGTLKRTVLG